MIFSNFFEKILTAFSAECYFRVRWRMYCPGCGGTRALIALLQGHLIQSIKYNPIVVLFMLDNIAMVIFHIYERKAGKKYSTAKIRLIINVSFLIFIIVFFLFRNVMLVKFNIDFLGDFKREKVT